MSDPRWALNESEVAAKVIDGEAIILNLASGMYYSLDRVGAIVWEMMAEGRSAEEIAQRVATAYDMPREQVRRDLLGLVSELLDEQLITEVSGDKPRSESSGEIAAVSEPYHAPQLNKYSDMADLLALDPPMPGLMDGPWNQASEHA